MTDLMLFLAGPVLIAGIYTLGYQRGAYDTELAAIERMSDE